jgi:hypothetical protein
MFEYIYTNITDMINYYLMLLKYTLYLSTIYLGYILQTTSKEQCKSFMYNIGTNVKIIFEQFENCKKGIETFNIYLSPFIDNTLHSLVGFIDGIKNDNSYECEFINDRIDDEIEYDNPNLNTDNYECDSDDNLNLNNYSDECDSDNNSNLNTDNYKCDSDELIDNDENDYYESDEVSDNMTDKIIMDTKLPNNIKIVKTIRISK